MPKLNDPSVDINKINGTSFSYSATNLDNLDNAEYTLATIAVDTSSSVHSYKYQMEQAIKAIIQACKTSDRADNLLVRVTTFNGSVEELHGFKLLENCDPNDYDDCLKVGGSTPLYSATLDAIVSINDYGETLYDKDIDVNGILFVITDGCSCGESTSIKDISDALSEVKHKEKLESLQTFLIGVGTANDSYVQDKLGEFQTKAGLTNYESVEDASPETLAKIAGWVSKSIVIQSQSLGSGGPSKPISLII